jgi:hypothetical protein
VRGGGATGRGARLRGGTPIFGVGAEGISPELGHPQRQNQVVGTQCRQAREEAGGASGMVYEHRCVMVELTDVRVAPEGDHSKLSMWRPSVVAV